MEGMLILAFLSLFLLACEDRQSIPWTEDAASSFLADNSTCCRLTSRSVVTEDENGWATGSRILLNASGYLQLHDMPFTYQSDGWISDAAGTWNPEEDSLFITALYPCLTAASSTGTASSTEMTSSTETMSSSFLYDESTLYAADGSLADVLCARQRLAAGSDIRLQFSHLFSRVIVSADASLTPKLQSLTLTVPAVLTAIDTEDATMTIDATRQASTTVDAAQCSLATDGSSAYTFLVPSGQRMKLQITFTQQDGTSYSERLSPQLFEANTSYTCQLSDAATATGIRTPEEFLEFAKLYNTARSSALSKYAIQEDGRYVVRILNDLDFAQTDMSSYAAIGRVSVFFSEVMDGMGHTLSHLAPPANVNGLFFGIAEEGVVRNLTLDEATVQLNTSASTTSYYGILSGTLEGTLENCHVVNSSISSPSQTGALGIWAGSLYGTIVNCSVQSCTVQGGEGCGSIGKLYYLGKVVNSRVEGLSISKGKYQGALCGQAVNSSDDTLSSYFGNCWVHSVSISASGATRSGIFVGYAKSLSAQSCFYKLTSSGATPTLFGYSDTSVSTSQLYGYDGSSFTVALSGEETPVPVADLLNRWVRQHGYSYAGTALTGWTFSQDLNTVRFE
jgi:hypothetical protein